MTKGPKHYQPYKVRMHVLVVGSLQWLYKKQAPHTHKHMMLEITEEIENTCTSQATDLTFDTADDFEIPTEPSTSSEPNEPGTPSPPLPPPDCQTKRSRTV